MWSLVFVTVVPWTSVDVVSELGTYTSLNKCAYSQNITQSSASENDPNGLLLCIKDFKNTYKAEEK